MNFIGILHEAKSKYAYAYDKDTLHLRIRTVKGDLDEVAIIWGDPFDWSPRDDDKSKWEWNRGDSTESKLTKDYSDELYDYWFIAIKPDFKRVRYGFILSKGQEKFLYGSHGFIDLVNYPEKKYVIGEYFNFPYINEEDLLESPKWVKDTVWYQIFPERFANGDPDINPEGMLKWDSKDTVHNDMKFGGDLQGIIDKLDYIADLGINGIYFTPIFEASTTHKYDTIDYFKIDPVFGTNEKFKELVDKAHSKGIKIMLDAVFNHCGFRHPYFLDVVEKGRDSKFYDCFHILRDPVVNFELVNGYPKPHSKECIGKLNYETFAFTPMMPKWKTGNEKTKKYLMDVGRYWIEEYDIDGWRLDVSNEVSHEFWRDFRKMVKEIKPDCFILGENWDNSNPWLKGDQFDGVMNYEFTFPIWHLLGKAELVDYKYGVKDYENSISKLLVSYPKNVAYNMFNQIDSHDTSRIMSICGDREELVRLAFVLQMTFTGAPSVYYGSEQGLSGLEDGNRKCMVWDEERQKPGLYNHVKKLIMLRKEEECFKTLDIQWIDSGKSDVLMFTKTYGDEKLLVAVNLGGKDMTVDISEGLRGDAYDLYSSFDISVKETIALEAYGFKIIKYTN